MTYSVWMVDEGSPVPVIVSGAMGEGNVLVELVARPMMELPVAPSLLRFELSKALFGLPLPLVELSQASAAGMRVLVLIFRRLFMAISLAVARSVTTFFCDKPKRNSWKKSVKKIDRTTSVTIISAIVNPDSVFCCLIMLLLMIPDGGVVCQAKIR